MNRRRLLREGLLAGGYWAAAHLGVCAAFAAHDEAPAGAARTTYPLIDTHIHLFDPTRPGGVPWPEPGDPINQPALPSRYEQITRPLGIAGAIAIEASPLLSDNDWVLALIANDPVIVGMVGDLVPGAPEFARTLERLHRNPLFLGIRYGNLWGRNLLADKDKAGFVEDLRLLAQSGLTFETANPNPELITAVLDVAHRVPELTLVIDHLPHASEPLAERARNTYHAHLAELSRSLKVFIKLSEIAPAALAQTSSHEDRHRNRLDVLWHLFGADKVLFGSDWPNSDHVASYADTFLQVRKYILSKGAVAAEKFFYSNSRRAYRWRPRQSNQRANQ